MITTIIFRPECGQDICVIFFFHMCDMVNSHSNLLKTYRVIVYSSGSTNVEHTSKQKHITCANGWVIGTLFRINSLVPGRFQLNFRETVFKLILVNGGWGISHEIALRWMPLNLTDDKSTLVQVMVWCRQATSHYLSQCWPRSLSPYDVTRPQWVNSLTHEGWMK